MFSVAPTADGANRETFFSARQISLNCAISAARMVLFIIGLGLGDKEDMYERHCLRMLRYFFPTLD